MSYTGLVEQVDRDAMLDLDDALDWLVDSERETFLQAFAAHRIAGEQAVVDWLRGQSKGARTYTAQLAFQDAADAIEHGEHLSAIRALKGPQ